MKTSTELALDLARAQGAVAGLRAALHMAMAVHGAGDDAVAGIQSALDGAQRQLDRAHTAWLNDVTETSAHTALAARDASRARAYAASQSRRIAIEERRKLEAGHV